MADLRRYTRWTVVSEGTYVADILGGLAMMANVNGGVVHWGDEVFTPDEARLYGVRLIEAACLADGDRSIRNAP